MKKYRKLFAWIFAAGILISGIGCGIGFMEFMSLEYAGERIVGESEMAVLEGEMKFTVSSDENIIPVYMDYGYQFLEIVWDDDVPKDTLRYRIEYNKKVIEPDAWQNEEQMGFNFISKENDDVKQVMEFRDMVLSDLKKHKIGSYKRKVLEKIEIRLNPENKDKIEIW